MKEAYPTLHTIGLGPQLADLERICAQSQAGKHVGESIHDPGVVHHLEKAANHLGSSGVYPSERDPDSGALHLVHAAARLLMAAACVDREGEVNG